MSQEGKPLETVYWARTGPNSFWPARPCTTAELETWAENEVGVGKTLKFKKGHLRVTFFGSYDHQHLPRSSLLPYESNLSKFKTKNRTDRFRLALEEAQAALLQAQQKKLYNASCVVCGSSEGDPNFILVCDRCYRDVHMACVGLKAIPEGDFYCPNCQREAPLTMKFAKVGLQNTPPIVVKRKRGRPVKSTSGKRVPSSRTRVISGTDTAKSRPPKRTKSRKKGKRKRLDRTTHMYSKSEESCFLCKRSGDGHTQGMIMCDFRNCNKMYHISCLGHLAPDIKNDHSIDLVKEVMNNKSARNASGRIISAGQEKWYCPWHYCAVSGVLEDEENTSLQPVVPSPKAIEAYKFGLENSDEAKQENEDTRKLFHRYFRCVECPLALDEKHINVKRPVYSEDDDLVILPKSIDRSIHPHGVFHCLNCSGHVQANIGNKYSSMEALPHIQFSRFLYKVWSIMMNDNHLLFQPFLLVPDENLLSENITESALCNQLIALAQSADTIKCMVDVKDKIFLLKYSTLALFEKDVYSALEFIKNCYVSFCPNVLDAAQSFKNMLAQKIAAQKKKFAVRKLETAIANYKVKNFDLESSPLHHLFPSMKRMEEKSELFKPRRYKGPLEGWSIKLGSEIVSKNSGKTRALKKSRRVENLVKAFKVLSKQPKSSPISIEHATSPSEIMTRLNKQEFTAKQLLEGYRDLKRSIESNHRIVNGLEYNKKPVSLDDLGLVAEFRLANKNLKAQIAHLKITVSIERKQRIEAETQLQKLKELLKH